MRKLFHFLRKKLFSDLTRQISSLSDKIDYGNTGKELQLILQNQYKSLSKDQVAKRDFGDIGFRKYSQNTEDGILLFIFAVIGSTNKIVLELCAGDGIECNAANLIINHGWNAVLFDGDAQRQEAGKAYYSRHPDTFSFPPRFIHAWITKDNVNQLIAETKITREVDLLSLDMDGIDYWIFDAIHSISPRVIVVEVQCIWGNDRAVTVPYDAAFKTTYIDGFGVYSGASLPAFAKLAKQKGYRFVGLEKYGFNAFFIRNDVAGDFFMEQETSIIEQIPFVKWAKLNLLPKVLTLDWQQV